MGLADPGTFQDEARSRELCRFANFANAVGVLATIERGAIPALPDRKRVRDFLNIHSATTAVQTTLDTAQ